MIAKAYAKINLSLEVLGKRPDGYHDIVSVMQHLSIHDTLSFEVAKGITVNCNRPELAGEDNLVLQAAGLMKEHAAGNVGVSISLTKRIPIAAGLGGGSSDAASTLRALRDLWRADLDDARLLHLAASLGSDVPFFLGAATALAEGRGERLRALQPLKRSWVVLVVPRTQILEKTRRLYGALKPEHFSDGSATRALVGAIEARRPIDPTLLVNAFERVVGQEFPAVETCRHAILAAGATSVHLSGSGPTLYSLCEDDGEARRLRDALGAQLDPSIADVILAQTC